MKRNSIRENILENLSALFAYKQRRIRRHHLLQAIIFFYFTGVFTGILMVGAANLLSLKFSATAMLCTVATSYFLLQTIRPLRYKALVITRRQRDKAMRKAEELKSKRVIVQNFNNMNIFGNNNGTIYGDNAVHNETHHHYGNESNTNSTEHMVEFPALPLLSRLVKTAPSTSPKHVLMPYRAAREAGVLLPPMPSVSDFNEQFGTSLSPTNYSTYITSFDNPYENDRDAQQFRTLKQQFEAFGKRE